MDKVGRWAMARSRDWRRWVLERWTRGRMLCWFVGHGGPVVTKLCWVHTDRRRQSGYLWRYVWHNRRRYYLPMIPRPGSGNYEAMLVPLGKDVQVPVMCAFFSEESGESLDIRSATGGCHG